MISLRKITGAEHAADLLVKWRNADIEFFGDGETLLTRLDHDRWYRTIYLDNPCDHFYMVMHDGSPVGTIAAILGEYGTEISRVLLGKKELARTGVMSTALELIIDIYPGIHWLRVKPGNTRAIAFYRKHGFVIYHEDADEFRMVRR